MKDSGVRRFGAALIRGGVELPAGMLASLLSRQLYTGIPSESSMKYPY